MIKFPLKSLVIIAAAFAVGAGAYLALGASPEKVVPRPPVDSEWKPVEARVQDQALADARWSEHSPWGAVPKPPEAPPPPPPPPPMAVGIVKTARGQEAIFTVHDAGEIRVAPGDYLPGGGRLLRISGLRITWVDAKGQKQEREMFAVFKPTSAPGEPQASGAATVPAPSVLGPQGRTQGSPPPGRASGRASGRTRTSPGNNPPGRSTRPSQTPTLDPRPLPPGFVQPQPTDSQKQQ